MGDPNDTTNDKGAVEQPDNKPIDQADEIAAMYESEDDQGAEAESSLEQQLANESQEPKPETASKETPATTDKDQPDKDAKAEPEGEKAEPAPTVETDKDAAAAAKEDPEKESDKDQPEDDKTVIAKDPGNEVYKVVTNDGARDVPLKDMVTTYQQYGNLQKQHLVVKPILEFARDNRMPADLIFPVFAKGIAALQEENQASAAGPGPGQPPATDGYTGPYKDEAQEKYFRERDNDMHEIIMRQHQTMQDMGQKVQQLSSQQQPAPVQQQHAAAPAVDVESLKSQFKEKVDAWSKPYSDYFKPDEQGNSERLNAFMNYVGTNFPNWRVSQLTQAQLSAAFAGFDEAYYTEAMKKHAGQYKQNLENQEAGAFAESDTTPRVDAPALGEQEQEIADMFDVIS